MIDFNDACERITVYNAGTYQLVVFVCNQACYPNCQYPDCYHIIYFHSYNTCLGAHNLAPACLRG